MKVLFVSSGNSAGGISPVVYNQGESLRKSGIELDYYTIKGKGLKGYLSGLLNLLGYKGLMSYNLIHAHYSLSGIIAALALKASCRGRKKKIIVSLMGSDVYSPGTISKLAIKFFIKKIWDKTIVKSLEMKEIIGIEEVEVIPNGVNIELFKPSGKEDARQGIGYNHDEQLVVFLADPARPEKNFDLAERAVKSLNLPGVRLMTVHNVPGSVIPDYLNATDLLLLTSLWEGSVNVVKEAMACGCPIVATGAGDVRWVLGDTPGTFITNGTTEDTALKIGEALDFAVKTGRTDGRERILQLGLDSETISGKLLRLYSSVI